MSEDVNGELGRLAWGEADLVAEPKAVWTTYWGGISIRECPPDSPPWWSEQMAINLKTNRLHPNSSEVLEKLARRWCKRHDRAVFAFGNIDFDGGVWAKVYPTDPRPSYRAFVELYRAQDGGQVVSEWAHRQRDHRIVEPNRHRSALTCSGTAGRP